MRRLIQRIFKPFFIWLGDRFTSAPKKEDVFRSLSKLYRNVETKKSTRGIVIEMKAADKFIIFSDQHKGTKEWDDDFKDNEPNYIAALDYYLQQDFHYINLGDCEELWKHTAEKVLPKNAAALKGEAAFQSVNKYCRAFGNHDLLWKNKIDVMILLKNIFTMPLCVNEGIILKTKINNNPLNIFLTHGHQGDKMSDNNAFSTWVVAHIWAPIQRYLQININTPAVNFHLRDKHNILMHQWSSQRKNLLLITGHTHKPIFASGKYAVDDDHKVDTENAPHNIKPSYFNTGCCCYSDGDITGIEITNDTIRLIKWHSKNNIPERIVLEEKPLTLIAEQLD